jgi:hypothetical protein
MSHRSFSLPIGRSGRRPIVAAAPPAIVALTQQQQKAIE